MPISNEVPIILQKNAKFQATNYEDIARGGSSALMMATPGSWQQELNGNPPYCCSVITTQSFLTHTYLNPIWPQQILSKTFHNQSFHAFPSMRMMMMMMATFS